MADPGFYTVKQVAGLLQVKEHSVLTLIKNGSLPASDVSLNPGGRPRWRITQDDLDVFIDRRRHQPVQRSKRRTRRKQDAIKRYF